MPEERREINIEYPGFAPQEKMGFLYREVEGLSLSEQADFYRKASENFAALGDDATSGLCVERFAEIELRLLDLNGC